MTQITGLWAWVVDDPTGGHGIIGFADPSTGMMLQAVSSKRRNMEYIREIAMNCATMTGLPVQLRHFTVMTVIDEVKP